MSGLSIEIPEDVRVAAEEAVASGRFATVSEYVAALIRADQRRSELEAHLRRRIESGPAVEMGDEDFNRIRERLEGEIARRRGA